MIVLAFAFLYVACSVLIVSVVWQDRRRGAAPTPPAAQERRRTPTLVFRTQV